MKTYLSFLLVTLLLQFSPADASGGWFKVINVTPIEMTANSEANFTVSVKGMGGERGYVELVFRNKSQGFDFNCPKMIKNVFPAGVTDYNCSVKAGNVAPGNYSFVVDSVAAGARPGKLTAYIDVVKEKNQAEALYDSTVDYLMDIANVGDAKPQGSDNTSQPIQPAEAPLPGAAAAVLGLLAARKIVKRQI